MKTLLLILVVTSAPGGGVAVSTSQATFDTPAACQSAGETYKALAGYADLKFACVSAQ